jgi:catechol 2,3-dioxygenase-like lactoylglutathione lyase family enzyme
MIADGNATVHVANLDDAIRFYTESLGLMLTNRFGGHWATVRTGPSYWTSSEALAGLTIGLHPPTARAAAPGTKGGVGFGLETYAPIENVVTQLTQRRVRVDAEIIRFEAGNVTALVDQDGLPTYVHEFPPEMVPDEERESDAYADDVAKVIAGGHAIVYVSDMDAAIRFYTKTLGLPLTNRFGNNFATAEAGSLVLGIHPKTPRTPTPGEKGSVTLGLTVDEPIERVVSQLTSRGVRITGSVTRSESGTFAEIEDPDGNAIYLWEETEVEKAARREARVTAKA